MLKIILTVPLLLAAAFLAFLFYQGRVSAGMQSPTLDEKGQLPPCPDKPNCVSSIAEQTDETHYIQPLTATDISMETLRSAVEQDGGTNITVNGNLLTATYKSGLFGFIDDLMLLKTTGQIDLRSSSRVGNSDFNANRSRVERLRKKISR